MSALTLLLWPAEALAYLDPGTGSLLYQTGLALLLGVTLVFRRLWARLAKIAVRLCKWRRAKNAPPDAS